MNDWNATASKLRRKIPPLREFLDGGHNTLAIGLYILQNAMEYAGNNLSKRPKDLERIQGALECKPPSCGVVSEGQRYRCAEFCPALFIPVELLCRAPRLILPVWNRSKTTF